MSQAIKGSFVSPLLVGAVCINGDTLAELNGTPALSEVRLETLLA